MGAAVVTAVELEVRRRLVVSGRGCGQTDPPGDILMEGWTEQGDSCREVQELWTERVGF